LIKDGSTAFQKLNNFGQGGWARYPTDDDQSNEGQYGSNGAIIFRIPTLMYK